MDITETPKQIWMSALAQPILEPNTKTELDHDFDSIFGAWVKSSIAGYEDSIIVEAAPAFTLLSRVMGIALEAQKKAFEWQTRLLEAQKLILVMKEGVDPNQRADGSTQDHHNTLSGNGSLPSQEPNAGAASSNLASLSLEDPEGAKVDQQMLQKTS